MGCLCSAQTWSLPQNHYTYDYLSWIMQIYFKSLLAWLAESLHHCFQFLLACNSIWLDRSLTWQLQISQQEQYPLTWLQISLLTAQNYHENGWRSSLHHSKLHCVPDGSKPPVPLSRKWVLLKISLVTWLSQNIISSEHLAWNRKLSGLTVSWECNRSLERTSLEEHQTISCQSFHLYYGFPFEVAVYDV